MHRRMRALTGTRQFKGVRQEILQPAIASRGYEVDFAGCWRDGPEFACRSEDGAEWAAPNIYWGDSMTRFIYSIATAAAWMTLFPSAVAQAAAPLGVTLGAPLGGPLPFGGGVFGIAALALITGIYLKRRKH